MTHEPFAQDDGRRNDEPALAQSLDTLRTMRLIQERLMFEDSTAEDPTPDTQPDGALVPPPRVPPTAVATGELSPMPPRPDRQPFMRRSRRVGVPTVIFDALDALGDRIGELLSLR